MHIEKQVSRSFSENEGSQGQESEKKTRAFFLYSGLFVFQLFHARVRENGWMNGSMDSVNESE